MEASGLVSVPACRQPERRAPRDACRAGRGPSRPSGSAVRLNLQHLQILQNLQILQILLDCWAERADSADSALDRGSSATRLPGRKRSGRGARPRGLRNATQPCSGGLGAAGSLTACDPFALAFCDAHFRQSAGRRPTRTYAHRTRAVRPLKCASESQNSRGSEAPGRAARGAGRQRVAAALDRRLLHPGAARASRFARSGPGHASTCALGAHVAGGRARPGLLDWLEFGRHAVPFCLRLAGRMDGPDSGSGPPANRCRREPDRAPPRLGHGRSPPYSSLLHIRLADSEHWVTRRTRSIGSWAASRRSRQPVFLGALEAWPASSCSV